MRQSIDRDQSIRAVHNVTGHAQLLALSALDLIGTEEWVDLIADETIDDLDADVVLDPYQSIWITSRR